MHRFIAPGTGFDVFWTMEPPIIFLIPQKLIFGMTKTICKVLLLYLILLLHYVWLKLLYLGSTRITFEFPIIRLRWTKRENSYELWMNTSKNNCIINSNEMHTFHSLKVAICIHILVGLWIQMSNCVQKNINWNTPITLEFKRVNYGKKVMPEKNILQWQRTSVKENQKEINFRIAMWKRWNTKNIVISMFWFVDACQKVF